MYFKLYCKILLSYDSDFLPSSDFIRHLESDSLPSNICVGQGLNFFSLHIGFSEQKSQFLQKGKSTYFTLYCKHVTSNFPSVPVLLEESEVGSYSQV